MKLTDSSDHHPEKSDLDEANKTTVRMLQNVLNSLPQRIFWKDRNGRYLGCNSLFANDAGLDSATEIIGKLDSDLIWAEQAERYRADDLEVIDSGQPKSYYEEPQNRSDGKEIWVETNKTPLIDDNGDVIGILGTYSDITDKKRIEEQAQSLGNVLDRSLNEIYIFDANSLKFIHVNKGALKNIGYSLLEMQTLTPLDIKPEFSPERFADTIRPLRQGRQEIATFKTVHRRKDRTLYPVEVHLQLQTYQGIPAFAAIIMDISVQQITQTALRYIVEGIAGNTGEAFFKSLLTNLAQTLDCDHAVIGLLNKKEPTKINTIAVFEKGEFVPNVEYSLENTPCENVFTHGAILYPSGVKFKFPDDRLLMEIAIESYAGVLIKNAQGAPVGLLVIMDSKPMENAETKLSLLQLFATRCGAELQRLEDEKALLVSEARFKHINEATGGYIWEITPDCRYSYVSENCLAVKGYPSKALLKHMPYEFMLEEDIEATRRTVQEAIDCKGTFELTHRNITADGHILWEEVKGIVILDDDENVIGLRGEGVSINERKEAEAQIEQLAFYDPLTNLPNRRLLIDRLQQDLALALRHNNYGALLFLDLDDFKTINDALGHTFGDMLLCQVAQRLSSQLRTEDTVARVGGDEFVILLPELDKRSDIAAKLAYTIATKVLEAFSMPCDLQGHEYHITPSIGVTLFPEQEQTAEVLLKQADSAMYKSKNDGRNTISFYNPSMQSEADARLAMEKSLRQAVNMDEFELYYQKQVNKKGQLIGAETLLRWNHPEKGVISPSTFIPLAEETGLIFDIGLWVLQSACQQMKYWSDSYPQKLPQLSVNISSRQFRQTDFVEQVLRTIQQTGINPDQLVLEITEGVTIENVQDAIQKMRKLKAVGVSFSIDDFGVGYSSLSYLRQLPLDELKIDRSFIEDIEIDPNDATIVETIISMARHLDLAVIAEGVERKAQLEFLNENGCPAYQGYYFSRPVSAGEFTDLLRNGCLYPKEAVRE
ncbi:MAG: EAL domain-containing protein [Methylococcaceae bacterium]